jgi:serine/threonine protein kinase
LFTESLPPGGEILKHTGDGFLALLPTASDAVRLALRFQQAVGRELAAPQPLAVRIAIHVGEAAVLPMAGHSDIVGLPADIAARLIGLALPGQILLTSFAFNEARQFVGDGNGSTGHDHATSALRWVAHGPYLLKGIHDPVEVFEVGHDGHAPLAPPGNSDKARRIAADDQQPTLGWRPAIGLEIPNRPGWNLHKRLGEGGFGEVWLAHHPRSKQFRVFKFCFDPERLRSFKRELTLFRLLKDTLGERPDITRIYEVNLDEAPFYVESEYTDGGSLVEWAAAQGGITRIRMSQRVEIVRKVAEALAAAHSAGVLHKDVKPSNVLIHAGADGTVQPRLTDFGIGLLADPLVLRGRAITEAGFTAALTPSDTSRTGTRLYAAPETVAGQPFSPSGDVYALGLLLYQMIIGDLGAPLGHGWERRVRNLELRRIVAACVHLEPDRRTDARSVATALKRWQRPHAGAIPSLVAALVILGLTSALPFILPPSDSGRALPNSRLDNFIYDLWYKLRPAAPSSQPMVVAVVLDPHSMSRMQEKHGLVWPWPRSMWADFIRSCDSAGAAAIAFDIIYVERGVPWGRDLEFGSAIRESRAPVVLGSAPELKLTLSDVLLGDVTGGFDSATREYNAITPDGHPRLALAAVRAAAGRLTLLDRAHSAQPQRFLIDYDDLRSVPSIPVIDLIEARGNAAKLSASLKGKIVVVGATGIDLREQTPVGPLPSVLAHATVMQNILQGHFVRTAWPLPAQLIAALATVIALTYARSRPARWLDPILPPLLLLAFSAALFCLRAQALWLPVANGLIACAAAILVAPLGKWWTNRRLHLLGRARSSDLATPAFVAQPSAASQRME